MATYIVLINFTDRGIRGIASGPQRVDAIRQAFAAAGGSMPDVYLVLGPYDAVAICEAPEDSSYARVALAATVQGEFRTTTLKALDDPRHLLATLPEIGGPR